MTGKTVMQYYIECWRKYACFEGRARRREFWMFTLFHPIVTLFVVALDRAIAGGENWLYHIFLIAAFLPKLCVSVRRLHDTGRSGWYCLLNLPYFLLNGWFLYHGISLECRETIVERADFPFIFAMSMAGFVSSIVLFVFYCIGSQPGDNRYGPNPKDAVG